LIEHLEEIEKRSMALSITKVTPVQITQEHLERPRLSWEES